MERKEEGERDKDKDNSFEKNVSQLSLIHYWLFTIHSFTYISCDISFINKP